MARDVIIFDTTLRDGEQAPGNAMTPEAKLRLARQLDVLGVDVIEAGFPAASQGDLRGVQQVADAVRRPIIAALARCHERDIDAAAEALQSAERKRIHIFIATFVLGMAGAFESPAISALLPLIAPQGSLQRATALSSAAAQLATITGMQISARSWSSAWRLGLSM